MYPTNAWNQRFNAYIETSFPKNKIKRTQDAHVISWLPLYSKNAGMSNRDDTYWLSFVFHFFVSSFFSDSPEIWLHLLFLYDNILSRPRFWNDVITNLTSNSTYIFSAETVHVNRNMKDYKQNVRQVRSSNTWFYVLYLRNVVVEDRFPWNRDTSLLNWS